MNAVAQLDVRARMLVALRAIRPPLRVIDDDEGLRPFETDAFIAHRETPMLAVLPDSEAQVRDVVKACRALGVPVVSGRALEDRDDPPAAPVVMVNQSFARHWFGVADPIGHRISFDEGKTWAQIVGVAADVKQHGLEVEPADELYAAVGDSSDLRLVLRCKGPAPAIERMVRETVRSIDPEQPVSDVSTLLQVRQDALAPPRLTALLLGGFALLALFITAAGIGGVIAYSVSQRTQELGIRLALGARPAEVLAMVLRQGMGLVVLGLALGAFGGVALSRAMAGLVFGIGPSDPVTYVAGAGLLAVVGACACLIPARRAASVDPIISLRAA